MSVKHQAMDVMEMQYVIKHWALTRAHVRRASWETANGAQVSRWKRDLNTEI